MIATRPNPAGVAIVLVAMIGLLLTGCSGFGPSVGPSVGPGPDGAPTGASTVSAQDLAAAKRAARIADCPVSDPSVPAVDAGLPDVTLSCLGGGRDVRLAGLRGRPMLINIWAQWCGPCRAEARFLSGAADELDGRILMLGVDYNDPSPDWAIEFAAYAGWHYPQLVDADLNLRAPLQLAGPPQTILVDRTGKIVYRHSGQFHSTAEVVDAVAEHLGVRAG